MLKRVTCTLRARCRWFRGFGQVAAARSGRTTALRQRRSIYGQVVDTILTLLTFNVGAFAADAEGLCSGRAICSTVPVTSTLWPTWGVSVDSVVSRRYSLAIEVAGGVVVPDVPAVPLVLSAAFVSTNLMSDALEAVVPLGVVPVVPVVPEA